MYIDKPADHPSTSLPASSSPSKTLSHPYPIASDPTPDHPQRLLDQRRVIVISPKPCSLQSADEPVHQKVEAWLYTWVSTLCPPDLQYSVIIVVCVYFGDGPISLHSNHLLPVEVPNGILKHRLPDISTGHVLCRDPISRYTVVSIPSTG